MRIILLGAGNVGTHLAEALHKAGHTLEQVYSRTEASATALANRVEAQPIVSTAQIKDDADLYIIAVKDDAIIPLASSLPSLRGIIVHTAGSIPLSALSSVCANGYGVLYPLQTLSKGTNLEFSQIPLFVEGSTTETLLLLHELANTLRCNAYNMDSEGRKRMHLSAVFACNFTNHLFALSEDLLREQGLPFSVLLPLIEESVRKVRHLSPHQAQTGPAVRGDNAVMETHLSMLDNPMMKEIYRLLSESIVNNRKRSASNDQ